MKNKFDKTIRRFDRNCIAPQTRLITGRDLPTFSEPDGSTILVACGHADVGHRRAQMILACSELPAVIHCSARVSPVDKLTEAEYNPVHAAQYFVVFAKPEAAV